MVPLWVRLVGGLLALVSVVVVGGTAAFGALVAGGAPSEAVRLVPGVSTSSWQSVTTRAFPVRPRLLLTTTDPSPHLTLQPGRPGSIQVVQEVRVTATFPVSAQQVASQAPLGRTYVASDRVQLDIAGWAGGNLVDIADRTLTVAVPPGVAVSVQAGSGAVDVSGSAGPLDVQTGRGPITLTGMTVDQPVTAHTGSGEIVFDGTVRAGRLDLETGHGPIVMRNVDLANSVRAHTGSGGIVVTGTADRAALDLDGGQGMVDVRGTLVDTSVTARTTSGQIRVVGPVTGGSIDLLSGQGGIDVEDAEVDRSLQAHTGSGAIRFSGTIRGGAARLDTTQGDIVVSVPADTNAHLTAATTQGAVHIGPGWTLPVTQRRSVNADLGAGTGGSITLLTGSGNITVGPR